MKIPAKHLARILLELDEHRADLAAADHEHDGMVSRWAVVNAEQTRKLSEAIGRAHAAESMAEGWKKEHDRVKARLDACGSTARYCRDNHPDLVARAANAVRERDHMGAQLRHLQTELDETRDELAAIHKEFTKAVADLRETREALAQARRDAGIRAAEARHPSALPLDAEPVKARNAGVIQAATDPDAILRHVTGF